MVLVWLCVVCGVSGSGKTTLVHRLCEQPEGLWQYARGEPTSAAAAASCGGGGSGEGWDRVWHVEYDRLCRDGGGQFSAGRWKSARREVGVFLDRLLQSYRCEESAAGTEESWRRAEMTRLQIREYRRWGGPGTGGEEPLHVVLLDDNHLYRSMRRQVAALAAKHGAHFSCAVLATPPVDVCVARKATELPEAVVRDVHAKFEMPKRERWEQDHTLILQPTSTWSDLRPAFQRLHLPAVPPPGSQPPSSTPATTTTASSPVSPAHRAELSLRRSVSCLVHAHPSRAAEINSAKRTLPPPSHTLLRQAAIDIPTDQDDHLDQIATHILHQHLSTCRSPSPP